MKLNKQYFISLIYSIFGSLGLLCVFNWYSISVFHETSNYPNLHPACIILGIISFIICFIALIINIRMLINSNEKRLKIIIIEIVFILITFIPLLFCWDYIFQFIGNLF